MGELADRIDDFNRKLDSDTLSAIATAVADLEILADVRQRAGFVLDDQFNQMGGLLDAAGCKTDRTPEAIIATLTRLADAEQRAAAAWTAVTLLAERNEACVGVHNGAPERIRMTNHPLHVYDVHYTPTHCVTAVFAVNAPANPDLLERASVELAEAYQRAKAEEQRQAEQAAADKENAAFRATPKDPDADAVTFTMRMTS